MDKRPKKGAKQVGEEQSKKERRAAKEEEEGKEERRRDGWPWAHRPLDCLSPVPPLCADDDDEDDDAPCAAAVVVAVVAVADDAVAAAAAAAAASSVFFLFLICFHIFLSCLSRLLWHPKYVVKVQFWLNFTKPPRYIRS